MTEGVPMRIPTKFWWLAGLGALLVGCSTSDRPTAEDGHPYVPPGNPPGGSNGTPTPAPTTDAGSADGSADSGVVCTTFEGTGAFVDELGVLGDPPAQTGGAIATGDYNLASAERFVGVAGTPGATGISFKGGVRVANSTIESVLTSEGGTSPTDSRTTGTFSVSATTVTIAQTCPAAATLQFSYTATGNKLIMINLVTKQSLTYDKR